MDFGGHRFCESRRTAGFTLIELMVVLLLIAIMTAVIIPEMKGTFEEALLRSTARKLVNVFNLAYSRSITVGQPHRVRLDIKKGRFILETKAREGTEGNKFMAVRDFPGGEGELDTRITIQIKRSGQDASEASEPEVPLASGDDSKNPNSAETITFYADGTADSRDVLLRDREGFRLALHINPTTARVHIVEMERE